MAATLGNIVRSSDIVCRMGGDEFILLCSGFETDEQAYAFAQRIKSAIVDAGKDEKAWAGISVGKASVSADKRLEEVIEIADIDLYEDKKYNRRSLFK